MPLIANIRRLLLLRRHFGEEQSENGNLHAEFVSTVIGSGHEIKGYQYDMNGCLAGRGPLRLRKTWHR